MKATRLIILALSLFVTKVNASDMSFAETGYVDLNYYYDTRDFNVFTVCGLARLPHGFEYYTMSNVFNAINTTKNKDLSILYSEQHFRWTPLRKIPVGLATQWAITSGPNNDKFKKGFTWWVSQTPYVDKFFRKINLFFFVNYYFHQFDFTPGYGWEIDYVYVWKIFPKKLNNRFYFQGFYFQIFNDSTLTSVTEHQLAVRLIDNLHFVAELRYSEAVSEKTGVGIGFQYKILFASPKGT